MSEVRLKMTCSACPEQYDAFDEQGNQVGYLRMRNGIFTVTCPGVHGEMVFSAAPEGDGLFESEEREFYLNQATVAIKDWLEKQCQR